MRGFLLALLAIPLAPLAAAYYGDEPHSARSSPCCRSSFIVSGFSNINTILLQKKLDFRRLAALELTLALISTVAVSVLAYILRSVWALVIGQLLTSAMRVTLSLHHRAGPAGDAVRPAASPGSCSATAASSPG